MEEGEQEEGGEEVEGEGGEGVVGEEGEEGAVGTDLRKISVQLGLDSEHFKTWKPKLLMKSSSI